MRKFVKTMLGVISIVICLSFCSCEEEVDSNALEFPENSRVQVQADIQFLIDENSSKLYDGLEVEIQAYEYYDLLPIKSDHRTHGGLAGYQLESAKNSAVWQIHTDNSLSTEEKEARIAEINAEYDQKVDLWKSYRVKGKYELLISWLSERDITATLINWSETDYQNARLIATLKLEDMLTLRDDGPHIFYYVDFANDLERPLRDLYNNTKQEN